MRKALKKNIDIERNSSFILFRSNFKTQGSKVSDFKRVCLGAIQVMPEGEWPSDTWALGNRCNPPEYLYL